MPSKGTRVYTVRIADDIKEKIDAEIRSQNANSSYPPWDLSDFIRQACKELLRKKKAGRVKPKRVAFGAQLSCL